MESLISDGFETLTDLKLIFLDLIHTSSSGLMEDESSVKLGGVVSAGEISTKGVSSGKASPSEVSGDRVSSGTAATIGLSGDKVSSGNAGTIGLWGGKVSSGMAVAR